MTYIKLNGPVDLSFQLNSSKLCLLKGSQLHNLRYYYNWPFNQNIKRIDKHYISTQILKYLKIFIKYVNAGLS